MWALQLQLHMSDMMLMLLRPTIFTSKFHVLKLTEIKWRFLHSSKDIRNAFIKFYLKKGHTFVPSSKVFSPDDKSLLFVNAGMNQFKPIILGKSDGRNLKRAVNSQRCIRAGGKHNDLDDVGTDLSHHTFFEMLGSWSFGDYFKETACKLAWEFLTDICNLCPSRLYVTYFGGCDVMEIKPDHETKDIWLSMGIAPCRVLPFGTKENFWEMGETGPCGPCTEIHYDRNPANRFAPNKVNVDNSDIVEIWNIVFMQYNRVNKTSLDNLLSFHVDTGMGLERIAGILLGNKSNYDTDLFMPIISHLQAICSCHPYKGAVGQKDLDGVDRAYRIVSDHIRMVTISIADGIYPGLRGRNLIVRQVLRRAVRSGIETLGAPRMFLSSLVPAVVSSLACTYPGLEQQQQKIMEVIDEAESDFYNIIDKGNKIIHAKISELNVGDFFPVQKMVRVLQNGYPLEYLQNQVSGNNLLVDNEQLTKLLKTKPMTSADGIMPKRHSISIDNLRIKKCLLDYNIAKSELVPVQEKHISVKCLAVVSGNGNVHMTNYEWNSQSEPIYLLFDKSFYCHEIEHLVSEMLTIEFKDMICPVTNTYVQGEWLLHKILPSDTLPPMFTVNVGQTFKISIDKNRWESANCAVMFCHLLTDKLSTLWKNAVVLKSRTGFNEFKLEISGYYTSSDIHNLWELTMQTAEVKNTERINKLCITKIQHQGKSKTILHAATGSMAEDVWKTTRQLQEKVDQLLCHEYQEPEKILMNIKTVGALLYHVNSSKISFDTKESCRNTLKKLSSRLRNDYNIYRKQTVSRN